MAFMSCDIDTDDWKLILESLHDCVDRRSLSMLLDISCCITRCAIRCLVLDIRAPPQSQVIW